jgi:hypothetical protein
MIELFKLKQYFFQFSEAAPLKLEVVEEEVPILAVEGDLLVSP